MKGFSRLLKLPTEYYAVFFLFMVVIGMSIYKNGLGYMAFSPSNSSLNMYSYENFENAYSQPTHSAASLTGSHGSILEDTNGVLGVFEADGLKASPIHAKALSDPVSILKGSPSCVGTSNGYSNSMGGLCLTEDVKTQFQTRGGNQSGSSSQIG